MQRRGLAGFLALVACTSAPAQSPGRGVVDAEQDAPAGGDVTVRGDSAPTDADGGCAACADAAGVDAATVDTADTDAATADTAVPLVDVVAEVVVAATGCGDLVCQPGENCPIDCAKWFQGNAACIQQHCASAWGACSADAACLAAYACLVACKGTDTACLGQCAALSGATGAAAQAFGNCMKTQCNGFWQPVCGDGECSASEASCPADCGATCGDDKCETGETTDNCPADCATCGDGQCTSPFENVLTCPKDCALCGDAVCTGGETAVSCPTDCLCGDGECGDGETPKSCAQDCLKCGDGQCTEPAETPKLCPLDCAVCGDDLCTGGETASTCVVDCGCGDGICSPGEEKTCGKDCMASCGNGVCDKQETPNQCPADCLKCGDGNCTAPMENAGNCAQDCSVCGDGVCGLKENAFGCPADCKLTPMQGICPATCPTGQICAMNAGTCVTPTCKLPAFWTGDVRWINTWVLADTATGCDLNGDGKPDNQLGKMLSFNTKGNVELASLTASGQLALLLEAAAWNTTGKPFALNLLRATVDPADISCKAAYGKCDYDILALSYDVAAAGSGACKATSTFMATVQGSALTANGFAWLPVSIVSGQVTDLPFQAVTMTATVQGVAGWNAASGGLLCGRFKPDDLTAMVAGVPTAALQAYAGAATLTALLKSLLEPDIDTDGDGKADAISAAFSFGTGPATVAGWVPW